MNIFDSGMFAGIFTLAFGGIGLIMLLAYFRARVQATASQTWPSVPGQIVTSEVRHSTSSSDGHSSTTYSPHIEFTYTVNEQTYQGKHIGFGLTISTSSISDARKMVYRFAVGSTHKVFYNPQNPVEAVLERKIENSGSALLMAILFLLVGIGACLFGGGGFFYRWLTLGHL
jgi:hypothetical protein